MNISCFDRTHIQKLLGKKAFNKHSWLFRPTFCATMFAERYINKHNTDTYIVGSIVKIK